MSQLCMNAIRDGVRHTGSCRSVSEGLYTLCGSRVYRLPPHVRTYLRISSRYACLPTNDRRGKPKVASMQLSAFLCPRQGQSGGSTREMSLFRDKATEQMSLGYVNMLCQEPEEILY